MDSLLRTGGWPDAIAWLDAGEPVALVTVIRCSGSTPRHPGAKMAVRGDGAIAGTIGGGRIELEAIRAATEVARGAPARRLEHHLVRDLAMCCGGSMELYVEPAAPCRDALVACVDAAARRAPVTLITELHAGGKRVEPGARGRRPVLDGERFVEPLWPPARLVLFGAGHVARAIAPLARSVGFEVIACDDGEVTSMDEPPAWADDAVPSFDPRDVERQVGPLGAADYVVILTRDHSIDQEILERLLPREELGYLGLIGSRGKIGRFRRRLEQKGIATEERWARLHAPVGLDIGAETPEEIAVAVVAELVRTRNVAGAEPAA